MDFSLKMPSRILKNSFSCVRQRSSQDLNPTPNSIYFKNMRSGVFSQGTLRNRTKKLVLKREKFRGNENEKLFIVGIKGRHTYRQDRFV